MKLPWWLHSDDKGKRSKPLLRAIGGILRSSLAHASMHVLRSREACILVAAVATRSDEAVKFEAEERWRTRTPEEWTARVVDLGRTLHWALHEMREHDS